jgi:hypothetical protein
LGDANSTGTSKVVRSSCVNRVWMGTSRVVTRTFSVMAGAGVGWDAGRVTRWSSRNTMKIPTSAMAIPINAMINPLRLFKVVSFD